MPMASQGEARSIILARVKGENVRIPRDTFSCSRIFSGKPTRARAFLKWKGALPNNEKLKIENLEPHKPSFIRQPDGSYCLAYNNNGQTSVWPLGFMNTVFALEAISLRFGIPVRDLGQKEIKAAGFYSLWRHGGCIAGLNKIYDPGEDVRSLDMHIPFSNPELEARQRKIFGMPWVFYPKWRRSKEGAAAFQEAVEAARQHVQSVRKIPAGSQTPFETDPVLIRKKGNAIRLCTHCMNILRQGEESAQKYAFIGITVDYGGKSPYVRASRDPGSPVASELMQLELDVCLASKKCSYAIFDKACRKVNHGTIIYRILDDLDAPLLGMKRDMLRHAGGKG
ncbi:MAG: hypothetical protein NTX79_08290 [Candidatus Micrarchaeota archaeon]|nr:hypothetical protein [Candidatus Micrarchaeota archaeon]